MAIGRGRIDRSQAARERVETPCWVELGELLEPVGSHVELLGAADGALERDRSTAGLKYAGIPRTNSTDLNTCRKMHQWPRDERRAGWSCRKLVSELWEVMSFMG